VRKLQRNEIVEKHAKALLAELRKSGFNALGIAGGIVMASQEVSDSGSDCHVFFVVDSDTRMPDGSEVDCEAFIADVAGTMMRGSW
jgi:hypothetical protein